MQAFMSMPATQSRDPSQSTLPIGLPYFLPPRWSSTHEMVRLQLVSLPGPSQKRILSTVRLVNCLALGQNIWDNPHKRKVYWGSCFQWLQVYCFSVGQRDSLRYEPLTERTSDSAAAKRSLSRGQWLNALASTYTSTELVSIQSQLLKALLPPYYWHEPRAKPFIHGPWESSRSKLHQLK